MTHILLAVTGMSPQVVTETRYGMAKQGLPWPGRSRLITTDKARCFQQLGPLLPGVKQADALVDSEVMHVDQP